MLVSVYIHTSFLIFFYVIFAFICWKSLNHYSWFSTIISWLKWSGPFTLFKVTLDSKSNFHSLKNSPKGNLILCEIYTCKVYRFLIRVSFVKSINTKSKNKNKKYLKTDKSKTLIHYVPWGTEILLSEALCY